MKSFLYGFLLALPVTAAAQPAMKLYAYSQEFTPGMIRQRDIPPENGRTAPRDPLVHVNYYIYAAVNPVASIHYKQLWIKGQWYRIGDTSIEKTPVHIESPVYTLLVPATRLKVVQLGVGDSLNQTPKPAGSLAALMKKSDLILEYSWKGKRYYTSLRSIKELDKMTAQ